MSQSDKLLIEPSPKPRVLILGSSPLSPALSLELLKKECDVTVASKLPPPSHLFEYVFQFSGFEDAEKVVKKYLKSRGKLLLIETQDEDLPPLFENSQIRFLKLGDVKLWDEKEAISLISKIMFRRGKSLKWDYARGLKKQTPPDVFHESITVTSDSVSFRSSEETTEEVKSSDISYRIDKNKEEKAGKTNPEHFVEESHTSFFSILSKIFLGLFILLVCVVAVFYVQYRDLDASLKKLDEDEKLLKWGYVNGDIISLNEKLKRTHSIYNIASAPLFPFKGLKLFSDIETVFVEGENLLKSSSETLSVLQGMQVSASGYNLSFLSPTFSVDTAISAIGKLKNTSLSSERKIEKITIPFFPRETVLSHLSNVSYSLEAVESLLPLASSVVKSTESKTYLVLFQNNLELRPTGGFIGSYGLLTINNGLVKDFKIYDVYQADGQLKGHVEPPSAIRKYLNQPNWYMRDSNWDPDFAVSADRAMWFLEKETGERVDGVIGMNLFFIEKLLDITGPLKLADFSDEEITSDNFIQKASDAHDEMFFPGSTAKKDFLTSVANTIFVKLSNKNDVSWISLANVLYQAFEEKQIVFFDKNADLEKQFESRGWAGRISAVTCSDLITSLDSDLKTSSCIPDYLALVEANLGVNKVNSFITKTVTITKKLDADKKLVSSVILSYDNKASGNGDQKSTYVNYLRILIPRSSIVNAMSVNGVTIDEKQMDRESYGSDKLSIGFLLRLAASNKAIIKLDYSSPLSFPENMGGYQLLFQKQGGDAISPLIFSFVYPNSSLNFKSLNFPNASGIKNEIYYTTDSSVDRVFALSVK